MERSIFYVEQWPRDLYNWTISINFLKVTINMTAEDWKKERQVTLVTWKKMATTDTDSVHDHMTRLRMKMVNQVSDGFYFLIPFNCWKKI